MVTSLLFKRFKKHDIYNILKHSNNYFIGNIAVKAVGFVSIPVFTRLLTTSEYGIISVFISFSGIAGIFCSMNIHNSVGRYYFEKNNDIEDFLGSTFIFQSIWLVISFVLIYLFRDLLHNLIGIDEILIILSMVAIFNGVIFQIFSQLSEARRKSKEFAKISVIKAYVGIAFGILITLLLSANKYYGRILGSLISGTIISIYILLNVFKETNWIIRISHIKYIANYSFPRIFYVLGSVVLSQADRIMISKLIGISETGLYSLGYSVGMLLLMVITATQMASTPDFFNFYNKKDFNNIIKMFKKVFLIILFCAFALILFSKELIFILADKRYHIAYHVVPWIVLGYVFYAMYTFYLRYLSAIKKTFYIALACIIGSSVNIGLNAIFLPLYGYIAAAYTTAISYLLMVFLAYMFARIELKKKIIPLWELFRPSFLLFIFYPVLYFLENLKLSLVPLVGVKIILLLGFLVMLLIIEGYWSKIKEIIRI